MLIALLGVGTVGYYLIEGWHWLDGVYMTFITLTTIGFNEVNSLSDGGRIFTILIGIVGIGSVAFIGTRVAQLVLTSQIIRFRHMKKQIEQLEGHYIIAGYGRIGSRIAHDLAKADRPFVVVDQNEDKLEAASQFKYLFLNGDAQTESTLIEVGIERATGLILTLPEDSSNVFATLTARELNPSLFILVRTDTHKNKRKLMRAGADKVVAAYEIGADRMAHVILKPNVDRFMEEALLSNDLDLNMHEVTVEEGSLLDGKTLAQSNFRTQFDAIVVAFINSSNGGMNFNPRADTTISAGDVLIVLGSDAMVRRLKETGCTA
ncbi:MAG: potassium channel protein [Rhodothermales bacterium]|nr:potassium channel protein [Rhodothermales bacterium]